MSPSPIAQCLYACSTQLPQMNPGVHTMVLVFQVFFPNPYCETLPPSPTVRSGPIRYLALISYRRQRKRSGYAPPLPIPICDGPLEVRRPYQGPPIPPHPPQYLISWVMWGLSALNPSRSKTPSQETYPYLTQCSAGPSSSLVVRPVSPHPLPLQHIYASTPFQVVIRFVDI